MMSAAGVKWIVLEEDTDGKPLAFLCELPRAIIEAHSDEQNGKEALDRLLCMNASLFPPSGDRNHEYPEFPPSFPDFPAAVSAILDKYEAGADGSRALKTLTSVSDDKARGIMTRLNPLKDSYRHGAFLGNWSSTVPDERDIWLNDWMVEGERRVSEGRLFKVIYERGFGAVLLVNWKHATNHVSKVPRQISLRWVLVIPILHFGECVGTLTCDFDEHKVFSTVWESGASPSNEFTGKAALLYRLCQLAIAPLVVHDAVHVDDAMMDSVARALQPPMLTTFRTLSQISDTLDALKRDGRHLRDVQDDLARIVEHVQREARRGLGHVNALNPIKRPFRVEACEVEGDDLTKLVMPIWREVIFSEANPGYGWAVSEGWLNVEKPSAAKSIPLPPWIVANLLRELLSNAYHAVCERQNGLGDVGAHESTDELVRVMMCGENGLTRARFAGAGCEAALSVEDKGIGMSPHARARSRRFGFSGRERGSGWGLAIVARQMKEVEGELRIRPGYFQDGTWMEHDGGCSATLLFRDAG